MATSEFYGKKIIEDGAESAAKFAEAAQQPLIAKMIRAGLSNPKYGEVTISAINEVFKLDGPEVAARFAGLSPNFGWIVSKIEDGRWDPDHKKKTELPIGSNGKLSPVPKFMKPRVGKTEKALLTGKQKRYQDNKERRAKENRARAQAAGAGTSKKKQEGASDR